MTVRPDCLAIELGSDYIRWGAEFADRVLIRTAYWTGFAAGITPPLAGNYGFDSRIRWLAAHGQMTRLRHIFDNPDIVTGCI